MARHALAGAQQSTRGGTTEPRRGAGDHDELLVAEHLFGMPRPEGTANRWHLPVGHKLEAGYLMFKNRNYRRFRTKKDRL